MEHLSIKDIHDRLEELKGWELFGSEITKEFSFGSFREAMEFVNKVGEEAERQNHHPDIMIRYSKVTLTLTTHDAGGITHEDFKLARVIEQLV